MERYNELVQEFGAARKKLKENGLAAFEGPYLVDIKREKGISAADHKTQKKNERNAKNKKGGAVESAAKEPVKVDLGLSDEDSGEEDDDDESDE